MFPLILETKLYFPPVRPILVPRPHLVERLQSGLNGPLTLLSAPAGYGKTTLLGEWRAGPGKNVPVAWYSIDSEDNDLGRFLLYLAAALDTLQPGLLAEVKPLLNSQETPNAGAVLISLVNQVSKLEHDFVLALDDYHLIEDPAIHRVLSDLIDHMPPHMHLAILTRSDPTFPLSRYRARSQLAEIRAEHLRFSMDETAQFLQQIMQLDLSARDVAALDALTEGWVASLQLVALSLQGRANIQEFVSAFTASHHYIVDYLVEEVLSLQPEAVRNFLIKTSFLDRLTGPLCDAVLGGSGSDEILKQLDHANLFIIPLDDEQRWYRYHHLFADLLRSRLRHYSPQVIVQLNVHAAEWFEQRDLVDEALSLALAAKDFERAIRLFCRNQLDIIYARNLSTLNRWLEAFPEAVVISNPWLCVAKSHVLWSIGQRQGIKPYVLAADRSLAAMLDSGLVSSMEDQYLTIQGDIITLKSLIAMNERDLALAVKLAQQAVSITPKTARSRTFALGSLYVAYQLSGEIEKGIETCYETITAAKDLDYPSMLASSAYSLANLLQVKGHLRQSAQVLQECLDYAERRGLTHVFYYGIIHVALAETMYEWNALDEIDSLLDTGLALCRQGGMNVFIPLGLYMRALLFHARGDYQSALGTLNEIDLECKDMDPRAYQEGCISLRLRLQAELGEYAGLAEWLRGIDLSVEERVGTDRFAQLYRASWILNALDRPDEALKILTRLESFSRRVGHSGWLIYILALQSVIRRKMHDHTGAMQCLCEALELAEPEGYVRAFLNQGLPMRELLLKAKKQGFKPEFIDRILAGYTSGSVSHKIAPPAPAILSKREIELLRLIAAGCSNKQIASQLFISVGTVKRHTANIFDKLDVKNRTEAVARARELSLLP